MLAASGWWGRSLPCGRRSLLGQTAIFSYFGLFVFLSAANPPTTEYVSKVTCDEKVKYGHSRSSFIMFTHCVLFVFRDLPWQQPWDGGVSVIASLSSKLTAAATQNHFSSTIPSIAKLSLFHLLSWFLERDKSFGQNVSEDTVWKRWSTDFLTLHCCS